jgi:ElaB/YqjD/DUF883 family membrane-anchored ribosome-binding protein
MENRMPDRELTRLLDELEKELGSNPDLSEEERAALDDLRDRIGQVLQAGRQEPVIQREGLTDPLRGYVDRFETSHPTLTMILGRIADALNKMGI